MDLSLYSSDKFRLNASSHVPLLLLALVILTYALYFSMLTILRFDAFEARALDLGNFDQAIWNTAHGRWFHLTNQDGVVNRLSLHVEPILIPISLLYHLYSSPKTLFVLQSTVVALGAIPVFMLAKSLLHNHWLALIFALSFLLNPSIQAANWLEFHALTLAPTFLLTAFYFLHMRQAGWFAFFAILAASCKEEIGLLIFMIGLYTLVILHRPRWGTVTMICSMAWAFLAVFVIQNFFATGNIHWGRYGYLGDSPIEMVRTLLTQPAVVFNQLQSAQALAYILKMLVPVGLLGLLAPEILLLALPSLGINLLADFSPMHQVDTLIYAVPIVPFVTIAGIMGAARIFSYTRKWINEKQLCVVIGGIVLLCTLGNQYLYGYLPAAGNYLPLTVTEHHRNAATIIAQIEPDAKVSAQDRLNPHVSQRETVYIFPRVEDADTVLLDIAGPAWPQHPSDLKRSVVDLLDQGFGIAAAADGYLLLKRGHENQALPSVFYTVWQRTATLAANDVSVANDASMDSVPTGSAPPMPQLAIDFAETLRLLDVQVDTDRYGELVVTLAWQLLQPTTRDIGFYIAYVDKEWHELHSTQFYPPTTALWYPTSLWKSEVISSYSKDDGSRNAGSRNAGSRNAGSRNAGTRNDGNDTSDEIVQTQVVQTLPWTLAEDQFTLMLGLYDQTDAPDANWRASERLPVTSISSPLPLFENGTLVRLGGYQRAATGAWQAILLQESTPTQTKDARFGQRFALEGVSTESTVSAPEETIEFTLHWRIADTQVTDGIVADPLIDYTSFVHLIDNNGGEAQGRTVAQLDWQPHDAIGRLPTSTWIDKQPVIDRQQLLLPADLPAGTYQLITGLYDWRDGTRLPVNGIDALPGNVVEVAQVKIQNLAQ